jgi:hypothetical protein
MIKPDRLTQLVRFYNESSKIPSPGEELTS